MYEQGKAEGGGKNPGKSDQSGCGIFYTHHISLIDMCREQHELFWASASNHAFQHLDYGTEQLKPGHQTLLAPTARSFSVGGVLSFDYVATNFDK
jgi:hypothetical protein